MNKADCTPLVLQEWDCEGKLIQEQGVQALIYSKQLWEDVHALYAIMREGARYDYGDEEVEIVTESEWVTESD